MKCEKILDAKDFGIQPLQGVEIHAGLYKLDSEGYSPRCSYCGSYVHLKNLKVKRPVPVGATDLGLFDRVWTDVCPNCGNKKKRGAEFGNSKCWKCAEKTVEEHYLHLRPKLPIWIAIDYYANLGDSFGCSSCVPCVICKDQLGRDFVAFFCMVAPNNQAKAAIVGTDIVPRKFIYVMHRDCYSSNMSAILEESKLWMQKAITEIGLPIASRYQAWLHQEEQSRLKEKLQVQKQRRQNKQCPTCGTYNHGAWLFGGRCEMCRRLGKKEPW